MIKYEERQIRGIGGGVWVRVVAVKTAEEAPPGATRVPDKTPVADWHEEKP